MTRNRQIRCWETLPVLIDADTLALLLRIDQQVVRKKARQGEIPGARKIGKFWYFEKNILQKFFEEGNTNG
ncbi:MAG: helix-turn-helix domain-containing protein [Firmicutes bacterium]|nr:helix-turn-helix domain-containing protein [[Eubacterium] siraeum]MCM1486822.1 helix-turn-helix domain-containing protein [Bacillota bacterium]